jgi:hypothetical protein
MLFPRGLPTPVEPPALPATPVVPELVRGDQAGNTAPAAASTQSAVTNDDLLATRLIIGRVSIRDSKSPPTPQEQAHLQFADRWVDALFKMVWDDPASQSKLEAARARYRETLQRVYTLSLPQDKWKLLDLCGRVDGVWDAAPRTLMVLLFFCAGLGLAPWLERKTRAPQEHASRQQRVDRVVALGVLVVATGLVLAIRFHWVGSAEAPPAVGQAAPPTAPGRP